MAPEVASPESISWEAAAAQMAPSEELVGGELLVEEVSIDGMCGVY